MLPIQSPGMNIVMKKGCSIPCVGGRRGGSKERLPE
jgi:hypothetical protein